MKTENYLRLTKPIQDDIFNILTTATNNKLLTVENNNGNRKFKNSYSNVFDFLNDCIFITDLNFNTLYVNTAFENTLGFRKKDIFGKKFPLFSINEISGKKEHLIKELNLKNKWESKIKIKTGNDVDMYVRITMNLIKYHSRSPSVVFGTCTDISGADAEDGLHNKRNSLLNLLNDFIKFTNRSSDLKTNIIYAIDKVCQYTEWDIGHCYLMINDKLTSTKFWNSNLNKKYNSFRDYTEKVSYIVKEGMPGKCLRQGKPVWTNLTKLSNDYPYRRFVNLKNFGLKSGIWIPIFINKKPKGVIEFFSNKDIEADNEIIYAISNICLELGNVIERFETFNTIKTNEKLAALGRFSAGIAHEIRNPLANISALTQLLIKKETDSKKKKHFGYIIENIQIAGKIIQDLLNYVSPDDLTLTHVEFGKFINKILDKAEPRFHENNIKIIKKIHPGFFEIYIDELKIENAILNFLTNSMDSMPEGGTVKFEVSRNRSNKYLTIKISDTGMGIPEEHLDKIYEPFFSTKRTGTGLGMGLALQAIKSHGGTLNIKSKPNFGTSIEIKLPLKKEYK